MRRHTGWTAGFLALALLAANSSGRADEGPARLLRDINPVPSWDRGSFPEAFARLGNVLLFRARTHATGFELWRTDGTAAGTSLVKDLHPGPRSGLDWPSSIGAPIGFVEANGVLLFPADDGVHGLELWRTDGTAEGTFLLQDIFPGPSGGFFTRAGSDPRAVVWVHAVSDGAMYFLADDGVHGFELWRTDGTSEGTFLLQDIQLGSRSAFGSYDYYGLNGAALGSSFYFSAANDASGAQLWKTDGTSAGTVVLASVATGVLTALGEQLIFAASSGPFDVHLWRSDGTPEGTSPFSGPFFGVQRMTRVGHLVYFEVSQYLYRTDGTAEGTILLHTFHSGSINFHGDLNGKLVLRADDGVHGSEPWISDGTPQGTVLLKDIHPGAVYGWFQDVLRVGGVGYFLADDGVHGQEIWRSDGTTAGTRLLADVTPGPAGTFVWSAVPWRGGLLLRTTDGLYRINTVGALTRITTLEGSGVLASLGERTIFAAFDTEHGYEPWRTDGTTEGTGLLADIDPLPRTSGAYPTFLGAVVSPQAKERALYVAYGGARTGLWVTDGTPRGTEQLQELNLFDHRGATLGGKLYFIADDGVHGWELWRSDGTRAGTAMVVDLLPGEWGALLSGPVAYRDRLYFTAEDEAHGAELWSSDGTAAGTRLVRDIVPGPDWSNATNLVVAGDTLFFTALTADGLELFRTDGTEAGTRLVEDIGQGFSGYCCVGMTPLAGRLLMRANDGTHGFEPWISDGTEEGTFMLQDIVPGSGSSLSPETVVAGSSAYFSANDGLRGFELWKTDGTEAGTGMVADIRPGPGSSFPNFLGPMGDSVVFMIRPESGPAWEVWRSDGSEAGTQATTATFDGSPRAAGAFDLGILFSEEDDAHGLELWRTDGTGEGTAFVQDVAPGAAWSYPRDFVRLGTRLLFVADDPTANVELFSGRAALLLGRPDQAVRDLGTEVRGLALPRGLESRLLTRLDAAAAALAAARPDQAALAVEDFARRVEVLARRHIDPAAAADLVEFARDLVRLLEPA